MVDVNDARPPGARYLETLSIRLNESLKPKNSYTKLFLNIILLFINQKKLFDIFITQIRV